MTAYLAIPPPPQQCPVCNPGLEIVFAEELEIRMDDMGQRLRALLFRYRLLEEARVIMSVDLVIPWLLEIFVFLRCVEPVLCLQIVRFAVINNSSMAAGRR